jgi:hypothetical protein
VKGTFFFAPPNIPQLPRSSGRALLESTEDHRDKLGRGPDKPGAKGDNVQKRIRLSFQQKGKEIRKASSNMRVMEQHMLQIKGSTQDRKLETTPNRELTERVF